MASFNKNEITTELTVDERVKSAVRDIIDFPKPGIIYKDITPILQDPELCRDIVDAMFWKFHDRIVDVIVGVESRGFLFGMMLAQKFNVPFVPVRKIGKLPYETIFHKYDLEYGSATLEIHKDAIKPGASALIHDDLLATAGTASAAAELLKRLGGTVAGFTFLISLDFLGGDKILKKYSNNIFSIVHY